MTIAYLTELLQGFTYTVEDETFIVEPTDNLLQNETLEEILAQECEEQEITDVDTWYLFQDFEVIVKIL